MYCPTRLLLLCCCYYLTSVAAQASFNFEISKRTLAAISNFMQPPLVVNKMSINAYTVGSVIVEDVPSVRKWEFTQLLSFETLHMVYAGFESGFFTGYIRGKTAHTTGNGSIDTYTYKYTQRTGMDNTLPSAVRKYWWADAKTGSVNPNGLGILRNRTYDHRARGWYMETKDAANTIWSSVYAFASTNELGLTHCQPMYDKTNTFSGVLAVDYTLGNIDTFLSSEFEKGSRSVFMVEHDTGYLVASSTSSPLLKTTEGGQPMRVLAINSHDTLISSVSTYLDTEEWTEKLVIHEGNYIQLTNYKDGQINWDIIVIMPNDVGHFSSCSTGRKSVVNVGSDGYNCIACDSGTVAHAGASVCTPCEAGLYQSENAKGVCHACPVGTWSDQVASTSKKKCVQCTKGRYSTAKGASLYEQCVSFPPSLFFPIFSIFLIFLFFANFSNFYFTIHPLFFSNFSNFSIFTSHFTQTFFKE